MIVHSKLFHGLFIVALTVVMSGCGSSNDPTPLTPAPMGQSGRLVGPVTGAMLFADNVDVSGGVRFTQDAGEVSTTTDGKTGNFILPSVPGYNYILVSKGGTDKLTGLPAMQMLAPAGSANVTLLTTLVALDTTRTVKAKLEALMAGEKYDADISTTATPAILLVVKSVETIVQTITSAITASAGSNTISSSQMASIQAQTMQAIALEFAKTTVTAETLSEPDNLTTTLQSAITTAVTNINTVNANIAIPAATATAIATSAVSATATAFALGVGDAASTTAITGGETAVMTSNVALLFFNAVNDASTTAVTTITATTTPTPYTPPQIVVVTPITVPDPNITGATGGSIDGTGVDF